VGSKGADSTTTFMNGSGALIEHLVGTVGYVGIGLAMVLENLFPPIPSELVLPFAGSLVAQGKLTFVGVLVASTVGSLLGTTLFYLLGWSLGETRARAFVRRYGRFFALKQDGLDRATELFRKFDGQSVMWSRLLPGVRSIISFPAGLARMAPARFIAFTLLGTAVWNSLLISGGVLLGRRWHEIATVFERLEVAVWVVLAGAVLGAVILYYRYRQAKM
jgi:membrane protein DedA with SNARE-associated domain